MYVKAHPGCVLFYLSNGHSIVEALLILIVHLNVKALLVLIGHLSVD